MTQRTLRSAFILFFFAVGTVVIARAQSPASLETPALSSNPEQAAQLAGPSRGNIYVVTTDQPQRKRACRIQSLTSDKLVCSRALGAPRTYLAQHIIALILPGDGILQLKLVLGLFAGSAAAIWGTVVLATTCPACAVGTGIAALLLFYAGGAIGFGDDQPDRLLYLAPGQKLSSKLGYVVS